MLQASNEKCEVRLVSPEGEGEINPGYLQTQTPPAQAGPAAPGTDRLHRTRDIHRLLLRLLRAALPQAGAFPLLPPTHNPFSGYRQVPGLLVAN